MKKFFAFALALILAAGISACADKPEATTEAYIIGIDQCNTNHRRNLGNLRV